MRPCFIVAITLTAAATKARPPYDRGTDLSGSSSPSILRAALESNQTSGERFGGQGGHGKLDQSCGRKHLLWDHRHWTSYIENEGVRGNNAQILDAIVGVFNSGLELQ